MMINLYDFLQLILYISLIILVIVWMVLGIKLIKSLKKVDIIIDDVNKKINKVDGVFNIIDKTTDYASCISDKIISGISNFISGKLKKKKGNDEDEQK